MFNDSNKRYITIYWFLHGNPIYDTDSESMMGGILIWHTPVSISFESHLKRHKEGIANLVFYYL